MTNSGVDISGTRPPGSASAASSVQWRNEATSRIFKLGQGRPRESENDQRVLHVIELGRTCEISAVTRVAGRHHVLGVEHLLGELGHSEGPVLLAASGSEGSEARHEEVEAGEGNHVHCKLPEVSVQLAGEPEASHESDACDKVSW